MKKCLSLDFNRCSLFDRFLLKFANSRHQIIDVFLEDVKTAPLVLALHVVMPPPFGTVSIMPFLLWYALSPSENMRSVRKKVKDEFHKELCFVCMKDFLEERDSKIFVKKGVLLTHMRAQEMAFAKKKWQQGKVFLKEKIKSFKL